MPRIVACFPNNVTWFDTKDLHVYSCLQDSNNVDHFTFYKYRLSKNKCLLLILTIRLAYFYIFFKCLKVFRNKEIPIHTYISMVMMNSRILMRSINIRDIKKY